MRIILITYLLFASTVVCSQDQTTAREVYQNMMASIDKVRTCTFAISIEERVFDKIIKSKHKVKLQVNPFKVYLKCEVPEKGAEVLYQEGKNNGKALVNPNKFPFINVNLRPENPLLRKNHQYTVAEMGFSHLYNILKYHEMREKENFFGKLHTGFITNNGNRIRILEIRNHDFGFINYKVMKGETITSIARKFYINDQMILDLNRHIDYFDEARAGDVISIPNSFARKIVFYIDDKTGLPLTQIIYDDRGLFSKVEFSSFVLNPAIPEKEFSEDFADYDF